MLVSIQRALTLTVTSSKARRFRIKIGLLSCWMSGGFLVRPPVWSRAVIMRLDTSFPNQVLKLSEGAGGTTLDNLF